MPPATFQCFFDHGQDQKQKGEDTEALAFDRLPGNLRWHKSLPQGTEKGAGAGGHDPERGGQCHLRRLGLPDASGPSVQEGAEQAGDQLGVDLESK